MATSTEVNNADHRAPDVRHLVYNMYRKMLTGYNDQANEIVDALPRDIVQQDANIYRHLEEVLKQQSTASSGNGSPAAQPPPPPPPSFPGSITGRRLKTEMPERSLEPPAAIQNAMMTKDKKPFTYTPGGIDLSQIRSPRMQRRITRNACADEMPGTPAPTINHHVPIEPHGNTHNYSAMQSQLPSQVLPPVGAIPPPPPPPPPPTGSLPACTAVHATHPVPTSSGSQSKPTLGRPPLGFDPNELLARINKSPAYEPMNSNREELTKNVRNQQNEEISNFEPKQQTKSNEIGQNIYVPLQKEAEHSYTHQVNPPKQTPPQNETVNNYVSHQAPRVQLGSSTSYVPPVVANQELPQSPSSPFGHKAQQNSPSSPFTGNVESKYQAPWVTVYRTPQPSVPWANRDQELPKPTSSTNTPGTRIIPIKIEGRDSPKSPSPSCSSHTTPPPFLQSQQARQQAQQQYQQQQMGQASPVQQIKQQTPVQQHSSNTRVIPIQIEGANSAQQPTTPISGIAQENKFNVANPKSPSAYSPSQEREQKPQWASVQPKTFIKQSNESHNAISQQQQTQPEYGTYNTAGVPLSQLRKMQLSEDDRALMDKFKNQVQIHGNEILNDENINPRYKGGYIPSRVFKMIDESVDEEIYLHRESDPRYRGSVIPSRAFRMLQCMTDTAGDKQQQVPRTPIRAAPNTRPLGGAQFQQEPPQGPYIPPSEQQVQEPRKYTGGSIPSRSFRMLQAMTGQEVSALNSSGPSSGRETPVSCASRWCPSPVPSPVDPFWACYYPSDSYFIYNYITELNAAYGLPPPPPPLPHFVYPRHPPSPYPPQLHQNYPSDSDEQGYSSTDELAQYYANYRRDFGYSPYQANPERSYTPNSFNIPSVCVTPAKNNESHKNEKDFQEEYNKQLNKHDNEIIEKGNVKKEILKEQICESIVEDDESDTDTEVENEKFKLSSLWAFKSVPNIHLYTTQSSSSARRQDHQQEIEQAEEDEEEEDEDEEEEISTSESWEESEQPISHQLSVIFEESEISEMDSGRPQERIGCPKISSDSDSCSTIDNGDVEDEDIIDSESSSVTVRLPLKVTCSRSHNDETVTTVMVGNSEFHRERLFRKNSKNEEDEVEENDNSDSGDISVTFTIPSRSNSIIAVEDSSVEEKCNNDEYTFEDTMISVQPEVEAEITIHLSRSRSSGTEISEERMKSKTEICESPQMEEDSSTTSVQSGETILTYKEDTDEENDEGKNKENINQIKGKEESNEEVNQSNDRNVKESYLVSESYKAGVGRLEELISSMLESTKDTMCRSMELSQASDLVNGPDIRKKESQEESEEDDSGVTSDMSMKQMNSETDADTESDYSELSKMSKFQRASTHSRLFKLLQDECVKADVDCGDAEEIENGCTPSTKSLNMEGESLVSRKQKLTLPLNEIAHSEVESLSSSSDFASPSSPTVSDRLVKELIHSLLNKKMGTKFRKLPIAKLKAAALKILQEEMNSCDTSSTASGDDGFFLSPTQPIRRGSHSKLTANSRNFDFQASHADSLSLYEDNYNEYLNYYNTWSDADYLHDYPDDYDVVPSKAFRMLREHTNSPIPKEGIGFKARCPRVANQRDVPDAQDTAVALTDRILSPVDIQKTEIVTQPLTFSKKREIVAKVLEKSVTGSDTSDL